MNRAARALTIRALVSHALACEGDAPVLVRERAAALRYAHVLRAAAGLEPMSDEALLATGRRKNPTNGS